MDAPLDRLNFLFCIKNAICMHEGEEQNTHIKYWVWLLVFLFDHSKSYAPADTKHKIYFEQPN